MSTAVVALTLIAVVFVCLEVPLAEGRLRRLKFRRGMKAAHAPHHAPSAPKMPKQGHSRLSSAGHVGMAATGALGALGSAGSDIANTVMGQSGNEERSS
ncbi:uncharacterized protein LOC142587256 [Dermacentor variabilis]|uniref:uncharacterized protein LOC142587256 n=1 Tax=Dermacentor variabilis TaxID=34621 RepID=UPI003F5B0262